MQVAMPYWEYSIDSTDYGHEWAKYSPLLSYEMYGAYPPSNNKSQDITKFESRYFGSIELYDCLDDGQMTDESGGVNGTDGCPGESVEKAKLQWTSLLQLHVA